MKKFAIKYLIVFAVLWLINSALQGKGLLFCTPEILLFRALGALFISSSITRI